MEDQIQHDRTIERDVEVLHINLKHLAIILGPAIVFALLLGSIIWSFGDTCCVIIVSICSIAISALSLNFLANKAGVKLSLRVSRLLDESEINPPKDNPANNTGDNPETPDEVDEAPEEEDTSPKWFEETYPDPDEELAKIDELVEEDASE